MALAGLFDRTYRRPRADAVVSTLVRLIVASKVAYREPLLDALYLYRRREGVFGTTPIMRFVKKHRPR